MAMLEILHHHAFGVALTLQLERVLRESVHAKSQTGETRLSHRLVVVKVTVLTDAQLRCEVRLDTAPHNLIAKPCDEREVGVKIALVKDEVSEPSRGVVLDFFGDQFRCAGSPIESL